MNVIAWVFKLKKTSKLVLATRLLLVKCCDNNMVKFKSESHSRAV